MNLEIGMPKKLERKLKKEAKDKGLSGERADAYTYGTLAKIKKERSSKNK